MKAFAWLAEIVTRKFLWQMFITWCLEILMHRFAVFLEAQGAHAKQVIYLRFVDSLQFCVAKREIK